MQSKLSEVSTTAIQQGERLREVRKTKRELEQENVDLKTAMANAQVSIMYMYMYIPYYVTGLYMYMCIVSSIGTFAYNVQG